MFKYQKETLIVGSWWSREKLGGPDLSRRRAPSVACACGMRTACGWREPGAWEKRSPRPWGFRVSWVFPLGFSPGNFALNGILMIKKKGFHVDSNMKFHNGSKKLSNIWGFVNFLLGIAHFDDGGFGMVTFQSPTVFSLRIWRGSRWSSLHRTRKIRGKQMATIFLGEWFDLWKWVLVQNSLG